MSLKNKLVALIGIILSFISCDYSKSDAKKYLPGKYYFEYPSKEYEILEIDSNFIFKQTIYATKKDYLVKKGYLHHNPKGEMIVKRNKIIFDDWLLITYIDTQDSIMSKPELSSYTGVYWDMPSEENGNNVTITMFDESNYIFKKFK